MNDDTLILYYYNDGLAEHERREVEAALRDDPDLARRYSDLKRQLERFDATETEPVPRDMRARFHDTIERAARLEQGHNDSKPGFLHLPSFIWGTAVTAALVVGVGIGVLLPDGDPVEPAGVIEMVGTPERNSSTAFTRGLQVHLRDSQQGIASLAVDDDADRALLILQMIQQNRIFERAAQQNDAADLARVLRAFEPILLRLAAADISPEDAEALRSKLAFELNVMLTKLSRDESDEQHSI